MTMVDYFCKTHDSGPFTKESVGSQGRKVFDTHLDLGCEIIPYEKTRDLSDVIEDFSIVLKINSNIREKEKLQRIIKFGTPIKQIESYLKTRIKNDPNLIQQLIRAYLSVYTDNPINLALLAPSSDGKTYATVEVSKIFPKEDVILVGRLSPTALIHQTGFLIDEDGNNIEKTLQGIEQSLMDAKQTDDKKLEKEIKKQRDDLLKNSRHCVDLKNKILLFLDNPHPATYEMLKPIMSHDAKEITYQTTKGDGSLNVKKTVIRNWPVFIFCSAKNEEKNEVWEEIKTRVFMTSPNSSIEKYKEANKLTSKRFSRPTWSKAIYENEDDKKWAKFFVDTILSLRKKITSSQKEQLKEHDLIIEKKAEKFRRLPLD